jgi:hypothetical protein
MSSKTFWKSILVLHGNLLINCLLFWIIIASKGDQIYQKEHISKGDYFNATNMILETCCWWIIAMFVGKQVSEPMVTLPVEREENSNDAMVQWKLGAILHSLKLLKIMFHERMIGEWIMKEYRIWSIIKDKLMYTFFKKMSNRPRTTLQSQQNNM